MHEIGEDTISQTFTVEHGINKIWLYGRQNSAVQKLVECQNNIDAEVAHINADEVLLKLLEDIGFSAVVAEWQKVKKWYS